jgi:endo-1,4-beta-D-glucanase Y
MRKAIFKRLKSVLVVSVVLYCLVAAGCALPGGGSHTKADVSSSYAGGFSRAIATTTPGLLPRFGYPYGLENAHNETDAYLQGEYRDWWNHYVVSDGDGAMRVQRDKASNYDTVSEGMGYGMLLAVYFNDQATFDKLYAYVKKHLDNVGLMHWMVRADNVDISEFKLPVPHGDPYMNWKTEWNKDESDKVYIDSKVDPSVKTDPDYVRVATRRNKNSATDADVDIATALCFAAYRWKNGAYNYLQEAAVNIKTILKFDVDNHNFLKNGDSWGGSEGWNPCYFTPAWFKVYKQVITDHKTELNAVFGGKPDDAIQKCDDVLDTMYTHMAYINAVNGTEGLYPDWCDTSAEDGTVEKASLSDRKYYLDEDKDGNVDDRDNDGDIDEDDAYSLPSFNYYYDAVRVPWRIGMDYSWYGDTRAEAIDQEIGEFFKGKVTTLVDGYAIDGSAWKWADRDGFNGATGGTNHSVTFIAMNACATLTYGDSSYASDFYNEVKGNKEDYTADHNYYGNCVRMMSLLYLSGRFVNFVDLGSCKLARKPADIITVGPLTIDLAYTDFGVYGLSHCDFHDRAKMYNSDGSGYANIGSGKMDSPVDDTMISGYSAKVGDIICGVKTLWLRGTLLYGNILARGNTTGSAYRRADGIIAKNLGQNPGCMDFSVDITRFNSTPSSTPITVESGTTVSKDQGIYGIVAIRDRGTLNLNRGIYYFYSLNTGTEVHLNFDTSNGPVVVCVLDEMQIKSRTTITGDATKILFICGVENGDKGPYIAPEVNWKGTLIAPRTGYLNVDIGSSGSVQGAFWGDKVVIHQETSIYFVPFDWDSFVSAPGPGPTPTPGPTPSPGVSCDNPTTISVPFTEDGAGEYCWTLSAAPSYINSWNLEELTINGEDFTNRWVGGSALPAKVNGRYYIHYRANYGWSHCEIR